MKPRRLIDKTGAKFKEAAGTAWKPTLLNGVGLGILAVQPVAAQVDATGSIGDALCNAGLDVVLQAALFIGVLALVIMSFGDLFKAVKGQGGNARRRSASGGHAGSAGKKFFGAVILAALPTILTEMGFAMVACFENISVSIFG